MHAEANARVFSAGRRVRVSRRDPRPCRASETPRASVAAVAKRRVSSGGEKRARAASRRKTEKSRARSAIREPRGLERRAGVAVHHARVHDVRPCPQSTGKASGPVTRSKALFAPCLALANRAARGTRNERAASVEKPKSRYRRSRSANRAALRAERAPSTSRRAASARNGVRT